MVAEGKAGMEGDLIGVGNTPYNIKMMQYGMVHLKPNSTNQCHPNKFNTKFF